MCSLLQFSVGLRFIPLTSTFSLFFFNDTATTEIYTLSLHDALPIFTMSRVRRPSPRDRGEPSACSTGRCADWQRGGFLGGARFCGQGGLATLFGARPDRKSTRLNSSHT